MVPEFPFSSMMTDKFPLSPQERDQKFNETDMSLFEAFAIFCGIGIHNAQMYDSACKMMAKQKVRLLLKSGNPDVRIR